MRNRPHEPQPPVGSSAWDTARLAAQIALEDPDLCSDLRRTAKQAIELAKRLEGVLGRFAVLEARFEHTIRKVETTTGQVVEEELFAQLTERLGVAQVRPALEMLQEAHPDTDNVTI